jgi:hypothetical protein
LLLPPLLGIFCLPPSYIIHLADCLFLDPGGKKLKSNKYPSNLSVLLFWKKMALSGSPLGQTQTKNIVVNNRVESSHVKKVLATNGIDMFVQRMRRIFGRLTYGRQAIEIAPINQQGCFFRQQQSTATATATQPFLHDQPEMSYYYYSTSL